MSKKGLNITISIILLFVFLISAAAHSGKTDANGGHAGSLPYHYHHGYPAHDHNGGVCPYDFDDKTSWNSDNDSSNTTKRKTEKNKVETITPNKPEKAKESFPWGIVLAFVFVLGPLVVSVLFLSISLIIDKIQFRKERKKYMKLYAHKDPASLIDAPPCVTFDEETFPYNKNAIGCYTVYVSKSGSAYHRVACNARATIRKHIVEIGGDLHPCRRCKPTPPDVQWYKEYLKIIEIKKKYDIP